MYRSICVYHLELNYDLIYSTSSTWKNSSTSAFFFSKLVPLKKLRPNFLAAAETNQPL